MPSKKDQGSPPDYPATPPPSSSPGDYGYFETVMQLQATMGKLTEAVDGLKEAVKELKAEQKEQTQKIEGISKKIYAVVVILTLIGFLLQLFGSSVNNLFSRPTTPPTVQQPTK